MSNPLDDEAIQTLRHGVRGGVYVNLLGHDEDERVPAAYGDNSDRLASIEREWDPDNLFRSNNNVQPRDRGEREMPTENRTEVVEQIARIREAYERAEKEGRFDPVAPYVAEDLVVMMPGRDPIEGKSTWEALFNEMMVDAPDREYEITYSSAEIVMDGELAFDRGAAVDTANDEGDGSQQGEYSYLWVYQRTPEESWELTHLIWNRND